MLPVEPFSFIIPAGGSIPLQCTGRYFRITTATGTLKVTGDTFGNMGACGVGQGLSFPRSDAAFQRLTFTDTSGAPNAVTGFIADATLIDNTLLGTVSVIDGEKARTIAGGYYTGAPASGIVAGQNGISALVSLAGSGKNVIVRTAEGGSGSAGGVTYIMTTALAVTGAALTDQSATRLSNNKGGSGVSAAAKVYAGNAAGFLAGPIARSKYILASGSDQWSPKGGIVLPPGMALALHTNVGTDCNAFFEWFEENV